MSRRLYVVAGEVSGDAHAAWLIRLLRGRVEGLEIEGVGGARLAELDGAVIRNWVERAAVMGVWEVLKNYGWFRRQFFRMLEEVKHFRPDVLLLVDYPGFNLRFAKAVREALPEVRIVSYVCPQVWAWNRRRIPRMAEVLDEVLCLFPFEQKYFQNVRLKTSFVGHPIVDELEAVRLTDCVRDENLVGLFPGSREREIARLFPLMLDVVRRLDESMDGLRYEVPAASPELAERIRDLLGDSGLVGRVLVTEGGSHSLMQRAGCAVIASGTATLEAAYYGLPYCLVYRVAPLTYLLGRMLVKIRWIGIVNILAGKTVVREFIQQAARGEAVAAELLGLLGSRERRDGMRKDMEETVAALGGPGALDRAAAAVAAWWK